MTPTFAHNLELASLLYGVDDEELLDALAVGLGAEVLADAAAGAGDYADSFSAADFVMLTDPAHTGSFGDASGGLCDGVDYYAPTELAA